MRRSLLVLPISLLALVAYGCGGSSPTFTDPGTDDTGADGTGSDTSPTDGGGETTPPIDDGVDTTTPPPVDTGVTPTDTGITPLDGGTSDAILPDGGIACTEPGAKIYNGHCYFRLEVARGWAAQEAVCAATVGKTHLVAITTAGEQTFVQANFLGGLGGDRWIGLARKPTDPTAKASFKWVTGEISTEDDWAPAEPNGSGACARMINGGVTANGKWADRDCAMIMQAICERE
jgi:hypothetical protein